MNPSNLVYSRLLQTLLYAKLVAVLDDFVGAPRVVFFTLIGHCICLSGNPVMASCTASWIDATSNPPKFPAGSRIKMEVTQKDAKNNLYLDVFLFILKVIPAPSTTSAPIPSLSLSSPAKNLTTEEGPNLAQGKVFVTFTAIASGEFKFHVGDGTAEISGSPFTFLVDAGIVP